MEKILILTIFLYLLLIPMVNAEEIISWDDNVKIRKITNSYEILDKDIEVETAIELFLDSRGSQYNSFTIYFNPWEFIYVPPIENVNFSVCEGFISGSSFYEISINCERKVLYTILPVKDPSGYTDYKIVINNSDINKERLIIKIDYLLKNKIIDKGEFHIFRTHFPNMREINITSYIVLPTSTSIPEKIFPTDIKFEFRGIGIGDKIVFTLKESKDIWLWYIDSSEISRNEDVKNLRFVFIGAILGFFIAIAYDMNKRKIEKYFKKLFKSKK